MSIGIESQLAGHRLDDELVVAGPLLTAPGPDELLTAIEGSGALVVGASPGR